MKKMGCVGLVLASVLSVSAFSSEINFAKRSVRLRGHIESGLTATLSIRYTSDHGSWGAGEDFGFVVPKYYQDQRNGEVALSPDDQGNFDVTFNTYSETGFITTERFGFSGAVLTVTKNDQSSSFNLGVGLEFSRDENTNLGALSRIVASPGPYRDETVTHAYDHNGRVLNSLQIIPTDGESEANFNIEWKN